MELKVGRESANRSRNLVSKCNFRNEKKDNKMNVEITFYDVNKITEIMCEKENIKNYEFIIEVP